MTDMKLKKWSDRFNTGIRAIDNDHRGLFEDMRFLGEAIAEGAEMRQVDNAIAGLEAYCREHFAREETFLVGAHYPEIAAHMKEHRRMTRQVQHLRSLYRADPKVIDSQKVYDFLSHWLASHILKVDMRYVPYLSGEKKGADESDARPERGVMIAVAAKDRQAVSDFVRIIESDHPAAQELARAVEEFERRLEAEEIESARRQFCRD